MQGKTARDYLETTRGFSRETCSFFNIGYAGGEWRGLLDHLRKKIKVPEEKFAQAFEKFGNTVSSTIPIALKEMETAGRLKPGMKVMLVGFGVGYSWGANLVEWQ